MISSNEAFSKIAESLLVDYTSVYYVDAVTNEYWWYSIDPNFHSLQLEQRGDDFFKNMARDAEMVVYEEDKHIFLVDIQRENLLKKAKSGDMFSLVYRLMIDGRPVYHSLRLIREIGEKDDYFVLGIINIDEEMRMRQHAEKLTAEKEKQLNALNFANEKARRDDLTGARNKNAYQEIEDRIQKKMSDGEEETTFGLVVCDLNNLKLINDTLGHKAGDEYIISCSQLLFDTYVHSPVFRIGGDEFVVLLQNRDYEDREELFEGLREQIIDNLENDEGAVAATGMSVYDPRSDKKVSEVFDRADSMMYADKRRLKERTGRKEAPKGVPKGMKAIPSARKARLDSLFEAFSIVAEGSYVYLCDMRYDYSRWSRTAVDTFGLPSEYMYCAGDIWEQKIHPQDREAYHMGIDAVFSGNSSEHDMQYRALRVEGGYDVCTCRGLVIRTQQGEPEYCGGVIRNHGLQGNIDTLTGLRNQYGFFEDLRKNLIQNNPMRLCMLGIAKFSEINEIYGYKFGNRVLQKFGRALFEYIGNNGSIYRLDGTKFAVLTNTLSVRESHGSYEELRAICRKGFDIDERQIILEMNAGLLSVDEFNIDEKTIYSCLNFAYGESKMRRQGDLVEFYNDLNEENKERIEKIHAIRVNITHGFKGFYLLYQPVVDSQKDEITGAEALIRWRDDTLGVVPPDLFIPILESDPLFPELGKWILKKAITDVKPLLKKNPSFTINVNLSYTQLEKPDFLDMVFDTIEEVDYPPQNLCLEITERCRLLDIDLLKNIVVNLRGRGIKIALDDFGTGFSSVGLLKDIPFDVIKIDRSFVQDVEKDEKEKELIRHFAGVAATFGAKICVEGIETQGMRDVLRKYDIHSFQGYYYDKPVEIEDIIDKLETNN